MIHLYTPLNIKSVGYTRISNRKESVRFHISHNNPGPTDHNQQQTIETASTQMPFRDSRLVFVLGASLEYSTPDSVGLAPGTYTVLPFGITTVLGPTTTVLPPVTTVLGGMTTVFADGATAKVEVPTTTADADGSREMGVPDTVIGGPPGTRVWPATTKTDDGPAVTSVFKTVMTGAGFSGTMAGWVGTAPLLTGIVVVAGGSEMVVPESMMAGPPGTNV